MPCAHLVQSLESDLITHQLLLYILLLNLSFTHLLLNRHICVFLADCGLNSWPGRNAINPLQQMWERFHLLLETGQSIQL